MVEQPIRNRQVTGSSPVVGSSDPFFASRTIFPESGLIPVYPLKFHIPPLVRAAEAPDNRLKVSDGTLTSTSTVTRYSRQDVLRILHIRAKQLRAWERAALISFSDTYSFQDLVQLRKLRDLRATRLSAASIRASVHAMQAVSGMTNPLLESAAVRNGSRLLFRHSGTVMEPIARQFEIGRASCRERV